MSAPLLFGGLALAVALLSLALALSVRRGRVELLDWLGVEPFARRRRARALCACAALACTASALGASILAPPQLGGAELDLVLAIDVSRSMSAADAPPSRLRRAVRLVDAVLSAQPGLRAGLVVFAGDAFTALPLTLDHEALAIHLRALDTDLISARGSDLSRALRQVARAFDRESERPRALLLLSDGEHAGGSVDAELPALRRLGVRVFAIGFGGTSGAPIPAGGGIRLSDAAGREVRTVRNDALLARVAAQGGGRYLRDEDRPDPGALVAELSATPPRGGELIGGWTLAALLGAALAVALEAYLALAPARKRLALASFARPFVAVLERARARMALLVGLTLALLGAAGDAWIERGDRQLLEGQVEAALGSFQRARLEGSSGSALELRIANALYRRGEGERAASFYLEALRQAEPDDSELRFVANFNLGAALLQLERFDAAREAFWEALAERPDDLEAKFNYEWAAERAAREDRAEGEQPPSPDANPEPGESGEAQARTQALEGEEARRWLESLEDSPRDPLRKQIERELRERGQPRALPGGQTW